MTKARANKVKITFVVWLCYVCLNVSLFCFAFCFNYVLLHHHLCPPLAVILLGNLISIKIFQGRAVFVNY